MNKELKKKIIKSNEEQRAAFPNLYDQRWVERAASKGYANLVKDLKNTDPKLGEIAASKDGYNVFAVIYYTAFENALNAFFKQCMEDTITTVELTLSKLKEVTAEIKTNGAGK